MRLVYADNVGLHDRNALLVLLYQLVSLSPLVLFQESLLVLSRSAAS